MIRAGIREGAGALFSVFCDWLTGQGRGQGGRRDNCCAVRRGAPAGIGRDRVYRPQDGPKIGRLDRHDSFYLVAFSALDRFTFAECAASDRRSEARNSPWLCAAALLSDVSLVAPFSDTTYWYLRRRAGAGRLRLRTILVRRLRWPCLAPGYSLAARNFWIPCAI